MASLNHVSSWRTAAPAAVGGLVAMMLGCQPAAAQPAPPSPARPTVTVAAPSAPAALTDPDGAAKEVQARASAYWEIRQRHDYAALYEFYSSTYRATVQRDEFIISIRASAQELRDTRVADVKVTNRRAIITMTYRVAAPTLKEQWVESQHEETWLREADGIWRRLDESMALPSPSETTAPAFPPTVTTPAFPVTVSTPAFPVTVTAPAFPSDSAIPVPTSGSGDATSPSPRRPGPPPPDPH